MSTTREAPADLSERPRADSIDGADGEVDRRWRLHLRWGSVALILATLIPSSDGQIMWLNMQILTMYATGMSRPRLSPKLDENLLFLFSACSWTIVFTGWLGLWISRRAGSLSRPGPGTVSFSRGLFFATWLLPGLFSSLYSWRYHGFGVLTLGIGIPVYLLIGGRIYGSARHQRDTPLVVFWFMLLPVLATLFGWACIASILFLSPDPIFAHTILLGAGGAIAMLIGLLGWRRAWASRSGPV